MTTRTRASDQVGSVICCSSNASAPSQPAAAAGSMRSNSAAKVGRRPRLMRTRHTRRWARYTPTSSRHNGDTIDLLERGFAVAYEIERNAADQPYAALLRQLLELAHRSAIDDGLAQFVIEHQELADGFAPAVAAAAAMLAAAPDGKVVGGTRRHRQLGFLEQLPGRH